MKRLLCLLAALLVLTVSACALELPTASRKKDLMQAMSGHIVQTGEVIGWYQP